MGQSASSNNHPHADQNIPHSSDSARGSINDEPLFRALNILNNSGHEGTRSPRVRRRSISPDTELQRRSGRLRRRLSRFVPSAISSSTASGQARPSNAGSDDQRDMNSILGVSTSARSSGNVRVMSRGTSRISRPRSPINLSSLPPLRPTSTLTPRLRNLSQPFARPISTPSPLNLDLPNISSSDNIQNESWSEMEGVDQDSQSFFNDHDGTASSTSGIGLAEPSSSSSPRRRSRLSRMRDSLSTGGGLPSLWLDESNNSASMEEPMFNQPRGSMGIEPLSNLNLPSPSFSLPRRNSGGVSREGSDTQSPREHIISRARPGEDQAAMLSRLLSVAATATAASLVGSMDQAMTEARDVAGDSADGSFESFLRALQNGRLAAALRNGGNELGERIDGGDTNANANANDLAFSEGGMAAPLNFFRMFRFGSSNRNPGINETANGNGSTDGGAGEENTSRMVPVIIVGIRSVTPRDSTQQDNNNQATPHLFDALANLPPPPINPGSPRRQSYNSSEGDGATPDESTDLNRRRSALPPVSPGFGSPSLSSNSPTLPPISNLLSTSRLRDYARRRSLNSGHLANQGGSSSRHSQFSLRRSESDEEDNASTRGDLRTSAPPSDGTSIRDSFRDNIASSSRNSRRAGGPNDRPSGAPEGTRSWIIYVLGGSYPENHPILTTPSLFTDTPTYEDMMLLSSLLGPAKPPVATQEDIDSAGGVFVIGSNDDIDTDIQPGERCLVCLSDFEKGEKCRRLLKCQHLFHKECIDEWLTTGRNSCPLCRAQGVHEQKTAAQNSGSSDEAEVGLPAQ